MTEVMENVFGVDPVQLHADQEGASLFFSRGGVMPAGGTVQQI